MKTMKFDIMKPIGGGNERFIATMRYQWPDVFALDTNKLVEFIYDKRPTLRGKPFNIYTDDEVVKKICFNQDINKIIRQAR